jgi:hypothetical protein
MVRSYKRRIIWTGDFMNKVTADKNEPLKALHN